MKKKRKERAFSTGPDLSSPQIYEDLFLSFISLLSQLLVLLLFNSILTLLGIPIPIPIIIVAAFEFEEDKVDLMEVQQALPPVPEIYEPLPLAQEPVPPLFEIQAAEVNQ